MLEKRTNSSWIQINPKIHPGSSRLKSINFLRYPANSANSQQTVSTSPITLANINIYRFLYDQYSHAIWPNSEFSCYSTDFMGTKTMN